MSDFGRFIVDRAAAGRREDEAARGPSAFGRFVAGRVRGPSGAPPRVAPVDMPAPPQVAPADTPARRRVAPADTPARRRVAPADTPARRRVGPVDMPVPPRVAVANVISQPPVDMQALRLAGDAERELGHPVPLAAVQENKSFVERQVDASRLTRLFEQAPLTARWALSLENAQLLRNDAEALARAEIVFAKPWSVLGQAGEMLKAIPRSFFPTLGSGVRGAALSAGAAKRRSFGVDPAREALAQAQIELQAVRDAGGDENAARARIAERLRGPGPASLILRTGAAAVPPLFGALADHIERGSDINELIGNVDLMGERIRSTNETPLFAAGDWLAGRLQETLRPRPEYRDTLGTQFGEALGSIGAFVLVGTLTKSAGLFTFATATGVDEQYGRARAAGLSHDEAMQFAAQGAPAGFIQALSIEFLLRRVPLPVRRRWAAVARDLGFTAAGEMLVESGGAIAQNLIQQQYDPSQGTFENTLLPGLMAGSAAAALRGGILMFSRGARRGVMRDIERAEASAELEQTFDALRQGLEGNELREAAPERFRDWASAIASSTEGGKVRDTVYLSPKGLQELAQSAADPALIERIVSVLPGVDMAAFNAAVEGNTDLAIPTATWITDVLGTEFDTLLASHIRFNPDDMTSFERRARAQGLQQEMTELSARVAALDVENRDAALTPVEQAQLRVFNEARSNIAQAGFTPSASEAYAAQYAAFVISTAERATIPLDEFLRRYPLADIVIDGQEVSMRPAGEPATVEEVLNEVRGAGAADATGATGATLSPVAEAVREMLRKADIDPMTTSDGEVIRRLRLAEQLTQEQRRPGAPPVLPDAPQAVVARLLAGAGEGAGATATATAAAFTPEGPSEQARPVTAHRATELSQGLRFRLRDRASDSRRWSSLMRRAFAERGTSGSFEMSLGRVPLPLVADAFGEGVLAMHFGKLRKAMDKHRSVPRQVWENLPVFLGAPTAIFHTPAHPTSEFLIVLAADGTGGGPVVVAIARDSANNFATASHFVSSVFALGEGEDAAELAASRAFETGRLVYEATPGAAARRLQAPSISGEVRRGKMDQLRELARRSARSGDTIWTHADVVKATGLTVMQGPVGSAVDDGGPRARDFDTIRPEVVFGTELEGDGLHFATFFADVTEGTRQQPTKLLSGESTYEGAFRLTEPVAAFQTVREGFTGNFDQHIQTSIPGFYEVQAVVGHALAQTLGDGAAVLDIGASEGALMKALSTVRPAVTAVALDPNPSMGDTFARLGGPPGVVFSLSALGSAAQEGQQAWTEDHRGEEVSIPFFDPGGQRFDAVHEAMVFQFISNGRGAQVARVKELMKPGGLAIFEQKFGGPADAYNAAEAKKDEYKARFYTEDALAAKRAEVLQTGGDAVEGMTALQASQAEFEAVLKRHFGHAVQFWSSGNFKGYVASDDAALLERFVGAAQDTTSDYSVEQTPRPVRVEVDTTAQTVTLPPETQAGGLIAAPSADMLRQPGWAVVSGMTMGSADTTGSERLRARLDEKGIPHRPVRGRYLGEDQGLSFLIEADEATALELGSEFQQESVLTSRGLLYPSGRSPTPTTSETFEGDEARAQDGFFETDDGVALSLGLDFAAPVYLPGRPQLPVRSSDGLVELHHWSDAPRVVIDPAFAGTGPLTSAARRSGAKLSFFGIAPRRSRQESGTGYVREFGLGPHRHVVAVDPQRLYPWFEDPDGIKQVMRERIAALEAPRAGGPSRVSAAQEVQIYEELIRDAGYIGYYVTDDGSGSAPLGNVAVLFEAVEPETHFDEDSGQVLFQSATPDWYYPALTLAVQTAKQKSALPKDWKAIISKLPGVKKAEIEWSGVMDWLDAQTGQVSREELARYLGGQEFEVETLIGTKEGAAAGNNDDFEVFRDALEVSDDEVSERAEYFIADEAADLFDEVFPSLNVDYEAALRRERGLAVNASLHLGVGDAASELSAALDNLRGGWPPDAGTPEQRAAARVIADSGPALLRDARERAEDRAREILEDDPAYSLTAMVGEQVFRATMGRDGEVYSDEGGDFASEEDWLQSIRDQLGDSSDIGVRFENYSEPGGRNYREVLLTIPNLEAEGPNDTKADAQPFVKDAHFPQENVVVHARMKDRQLGDRRVLFAEEMQSDLRSSWAEAGGQPEGFVDVAKEQAIAAREAFQPEYRAFLRKLAEARDAVMNPVRDFVRAAIIDRTEEGGTLRGKLLAIVNDDALFDASVRHATAEWFYGEKRARGLDIGRASVVLTAVEAFDHFAETKDAAFARWQEIESRAGAMDDRARELDNAVRDAAKGDGGLPYTPFDGPAAYEVMTKRLLNMAAVEGYDAFAWTPGYMQARRWSGAVQNVVEKIEWDTKEEINLLARDEADEGLRNAQNELHRTSFFLASLLDREYGVLDGLRFTLDDVRVAAQFLAPRVREHGPENPDRVLRDSGLEGDERVLHERILRAMVQLRDVDNSLYARWASAELGRRDAVAARDRAVSNLASADTRVVTLIGANGRDKFVVDDAGVITNKVGGGRIPFEQVRGRNLSELIGAPMTRAILGNRTGVQPGQNIVIGGEGYLNVYDRQIRKFVEKFAKRHGSKVEQRRDMPDFSDVNAVRENFAGLPTEDMGQALDLLGGETEVVRAGVRASMQRRRAQAVVSLDRTNLAVEALQEAIGIVAERGEDGIDFLRTRPSVGPQVIAGAQRAFNTGGAEEAGVFLRARLSGAQSEAAEETSDLERWPDPDNPADFEQAYRDGLTEAFQQVWARTRGTPNAIAAITERWPQLLGDAARFVWFVEITPQMREAASKPQPLFQNNRGKIVLPPRYQRPTITLFEGSDLSTLLHEMGHQYLFILQDLAASGEMGEDLKRDWTTVRAWWRQNAEAVAADAGEGVTAEQVRRYLDRGTTGDGNVDRAVNVGMQEQWARGMEKFLLEGSAPSLSLRKAFASFKAWLTAIYKRAVALNVDVSPEMHDVFSRLFATEEEIAFARETQAVDKLVADSAEALGISEDDYRKLIDLQREAQAEAEQTLLAEIMAPIRRQQTAEAKAERERLTEQIRARVQAEPVHRVREWLGNGRWLGDAERPDFLPEGARLDRRQIVDRYGENTLRLLPRGRSPLYSRRGDKGLDLDEVAGWFGFASGDAMVQALLRAPKIEAQVQAEVTDEVKRRQPEPLADDHIEAAAVDALHGDKASQLLVAELRALSKGQGVKGQVTPRQAAREIARRTIAGMEARKAVRSHVWQAAERRAATEAQEALARGDRQAAFDAKRRQLLNHMLYSESRKAAELVGKLENAAGRLRRKGVRENLAGEYLDAIDEVLDTYEFRRVSGRQLDRRGALLRYIAFMTDLGRENELAIPPEVLERAQQINYMQLSVTHVQGVLDTLANIEHTARFKQKLRDAKEQRDLDDVVDSVVASFDANLRSRPRGRVQTRADRRRKGVRQYLNLILRAGTILRKIDGFKDHGAAVREIKQGIDEGSRDLTERRQALALRLEELYGVYTRREQNRMSVRRRNEDAGTELSKWDVISIALNMGNMDNLERLTDPDSRGFTRDQLDRITSGMDKRDWDFAQGMWDLIDSFWPEIAARERRLTGVAPKKVEALPVETPFGTYRGGYYPIMYDGDLSAQVNVEQTDDLMRNMRAGRFGKAQTANGHLKERKSGSGGRPLMIGIEVAHRHLGRVVHDLALSEAVTSSWRILQHPRLRGAFAEAGLLDDLDTLELWLQDVASGQLAAADMPSRIFRRLKSNFTLSKLAFNMSTVLVQVTGLAQSVVAIGPRAFAAGAITYAKSPIGTALEIEAKSSFMRNRQTTFNKDINDILGDVTLGPLEATWDRAIRKYAGPAGFWLMQKVQYYTVDIPTWIAVYQKDVKEGVSDAQAILNADATVVRAQAGGEFSDRSAFERGTLSRGTRQSDVVRLFTTLGSYMFAKFNVAYERTGRATQVFRDEGLGTRSAREAVSYAFDMATLFALEAVLYAAIMGRLPDEEDEERLNVAWAKFLARETAFGVMSTLPYVRDVTGPLQGFAAGGAYGGITGEISDTVARPFLMAERGEIGLPGAKAFVRGTGLATGLPATAINRVLDGLWRSAEGDDVAVIEYLMGRR